MLFDKEIFHTKNIEPGADFISRTAVRAIIFRNGKLLMVHSRSNQEYKFPGGGIENEETEEHALAREISEEIGGKLLRIHKKLGTVVEFNKSEQDKGKFFRMTSNYYSVEIAEEFGSQNLDEYEKEEKSKWIERETYVLRCLHEAYLNESLI